MILRAPLQAAPVTRNLGTLPFSLTLYLDLETFNDVDIAVGTHRYAETAEIMLFAYAIDGAPATCWDVTTGEPMPEELAAALADPSVKIIAHNASFDRTVLQARGYETERTRWRCSMTLAYSHSLPGALDKLCDLYGLSEDEGKISDGRRLVLKFCKPQGKNVKVRRRTRETDPDDWRRFIDYAVRDVEAMRKIVRQLPRWNWTDSEVELYHLDMLINERGFAIDLELARAAQRAIDTEQKRLAQRTQTLTGDAVDSATRRDALLDFLKEDTGLHLPDLRASTVERALERLELDPVTSELLLTRLQATTSSTAKYRAVERAASSDGRLRGALQFRGASRTGRYAGRNFQPQNLARPPKHLKKADIAAGIEAIKSDVVDLVTDNVMEMCSAALRGVIVSAPGKKLVVCDLANIEGRLLAWLAGEDWEVAAFRAYDAKTGPDLYKLTYARAFGVPVETVDDAQRQVGKVMCLALGYGGGVGAFATMAAGYGLDLDALAPALLQTLPDHYQEQAQDAWLWAVANKRTLGFAQNTYVAIDALKRAWRRAHPRTVQLWRDVGAALQKLTEMCDAATVLKPVKPIHVGAHLSLDVVRRHGRFWLRVRLPSGRYLSYPEPKFDDKGRWSYMGVHQYTRQWSRIPSYDAKVVENLTQAAAADILLHGMSRAEGAGYSVVLSVHDELVTEPPDDARYDVHGLANLMTDAPPWAAGLPLAAEGFETKRYRK